MILKMFCELNVSIPKLDQEIEKFKGQITFKWGEYKKPCKTGKQKTGGYASNLSVGGVVEREGNVIAHVIQNTSFSEMKKLIDDNVKKTRKETVLLTD